MLEIRDTDPTDEVALRVWFDTWIASQAHRSPDFLETWEAARLALPRPHPDFSLDLLTAYDGDLPVGMALINRPMKDNLGVAYAEVCAVPDHRGRGVGTALLDVVETRCRADGRHRVLVEVYTPPGGRSRDVEFAEARGYTRANREEMKALDLAAAASGWGPLEDEAAAARGDYRIHVWRDRVPDEHVEQVCALLGRFMSLVPQGDLDLEDGEWTAERYRAAEQRRTDIGAATILAAASAPDGSLVAASEVRINTHDPRVAHVSITMVLPGHRGHRLGLATKLATHRALRAAFPECHLVVTSNAGVNEHMNAINQALGYRVVEDLLEYHRPV